MPENLCFAYAFANLPIDFDSIAVELRNAVVDKITYYKDKRQVTINMTSFASVSSEEISVLADKLNYLYPFIFDLRVEMPPQEIIRSDTVSKAINGSGKERYNYNDSSFNGGNRSRNGKGVKVSKSMIGARTKLSDELNAGDEIIFDGIVFATDNRTTKSGRILVSFDMTDGTDSITVKMFCQPEDFERYKELVSVDSALAVKGKIQYDEFSHEINIMADELARIEIAKRMDNAEVKRVELHLHTKMSSMDGITASVKFAERAIEWGHTAIAFTDHGVLQAYPEIMKYAKNIKIIYGVEAYLVDDSDCAESVSDLERAKQRSYHAIILCKNQQGLRNLYELVSKSHINYFYKRPRIPKSEFTRLREGLIIGSACEAGELYRAVYNHHTSKIDETGKLADKINELAEFYDYYEIQPLGNNEYMLRNNKLNSRQDLIDINVKITELGEKYNKPVVATCDVHFIDPEDEVYRRILMAGEGYSDADLQAPLYFRTTDEMLAEFDYFGKEKAYEVVVENTNRIADMIAKIKPIPDGTYPPIIDGAVEEITKIAMDKVYETYACDGVLPEIVRERFDRELAAITGYGFAVLYYAAYKLVNKSISDGYLVGSRGSVGSSLVATMSNITEVNPLSPHYLCKNCRYSDFDSELVRSYAGGSGYDMPDQNCPVCGTKMTKDGHDIPFETFLGFEGDKEPDIDLNFSGEYQAIAHAYTDELFGRENVFKAGTIGTLAEKTAYGFVLKYLESKNRKPRRAEINRLVLGCSGVKRTTGQHPGGLMIVPRGRSIYEFCPVQYPANDEKSGVITTHFDYHSSLEGRLMKLDILGHDVPTMIHMLYDITGVDPLTVDLGDKRIMSLFRVPDELGLSDEELGAGTGSLGLPEFGTAFVRQMLLETQPDSFAELVRISGLSHGTDVWNNNAQDLIAQKTATLKEVIPTRDDIMVYLINQGLEKKTAFTIMEHIRKKNIGLQPEDEDILENHGIDDWYIDSCKKIKYLFPKGHAVAYVMMTVRIAYYKIYHPVAFYAATFSVKAEDFDYELMCAGLEKAKSEALRIRNLGNDATAKEKNVLNVLELVIEMYLRGIKFTPLDLYKTKADKFTVVGEGLLMPPLLSVQGLGMNVANKIVEERNRGDFFSVEEFIERTRANKTVVELLRSNNILRGIPESSQISLF